MDHVAALVEHLFRREAGRMVSALTRLFGPRNLSRAEDVVQDVLGRALEVWKFRGIPENPSAWLMSAAKNRVIDLIRRDQTARSFASMFAAELQCRGEDVDQAAETLFEVKSMKDDQLRMMFSCCDPALPEEGQVALMLHILCGFSIDEIAGAFLATHHAIEKRVLRAKKLLAASQRLFILNDSDVAERLPTVQRALYLLFNEGYHGANSQLAVRADLCKEAAYLAMLLLENPCGKTPSTYGLGALMFLLSARLPARVDAWGNLISLDHQDRSKWDAELIAKGHELLEHSASGSALTQYQIEAAIAAIHSAAERTEDTRWDTIVVLYDTLLSLQPSAVVSLNRAIAIGQLEGPERALEEIGKIADHDKLAEYPFYWAALGELELRRYRPGIAGEHFIKACSLARNPAEKVFFRNRFSECK